MPSSACKTSARSEEHTSELQSHDNLVCRLLLEKKTMQTACTSPYLVCTSRSEESSASNIFCMPMSRTCWIWFLVYSFFFLKKRAPPEFPPFPPPPPFPS